jgi:hypothetical protein
VRLRFLKPRAGTRWYGPAAYCTDYALVPRPGYYALSDDGKQLRKPLLRLVCVDDAPGDNKDGSCHYEVAGKNDPVQRQGKVVKMKARLEGTAGINQ